MIKKSAHKLFWIGNDKNLGRVGIFLNEKWMDKFTYIDNVSDRMILIKVSVQGIIVTVIAVNALCFVQCW